MFIKPLANSQTLLWRASSIFTIFCLLFCSACIQTETDKIVQTVNSTVAQITSDQGNWQTYMLQLETKLTSDGSSLAKNVLTQVQNILNEGIALAGTTINCTIDIQSNHIVIRLKNIIHSLKNEALETAPPKVCSIVPPTVDLGNIQPIININGADLSANLMPSFSVGGATITYPNVYLGHVSDYNLTFNVAQLISDHRMPQSGKIIFTWPQNSSTSEILIQAAPSCSDGIKNGLETDIDCGGNCGGCAVGKSCNAEKDCANSICSTNICRAYTITPYADEISYGGGQGGSPAPTVQCGLNKVAVGIFGYAGDYINQIGLWCGDVNPTGLGAIIKSNVSNTTTGGQYFSYPCSSGKVMVGIDGSSGAYVNQMGPICVPLEKVASQNPNDYPQTREGMAGSVIGGTSNLQPMCPTGTVITALNNIRTGNYVDHVDMYCGFKINY